MDLNTSEIITISNLLLHSNIHSISFSNNRMMGDMGAVALTNNLPPSVHEIGLVGCGIGDIGGMALLNKANELINLKILCLEQNNFSDHIKAEFYRFSSRNPAVVVVV